MSNIEDWTNPNTGPLSAIVGLRVFQNQNLVVAKLLANNEDYRSKTDEELIQNTTRFRADFGHFVDTLKKNGFSISITFKGPTGKGNTKYPFALITVNNITSTVRTKLIAAIQAYEAEFMQAENDDSVDEATAAPAAPAARSVSRSVPFASLAASAPAPAPAPTPAPVPAPPETPSHKLAYLQAQQKTLDQTQAELTQQQDAIDKQKKELAAAISAAEKAAKADNSKRLQELLAGLSDEDVAAIMADRVNRLSAPVPVHASDTTTIA